MPNIYGHSKSPLNIKKIDLRVWKLRDELETVIENELKQDPEKNLQMLTFGLVKEYSVTDGPGPISLQDIIQNRPVDDMDDENEDGEKNTDSDSSDVDDLVNKEESLSDKENVVLQKKIFPAETKISRAQMLLSEIDMEKMFIFCEHQFIIGNSVIIEFILPQSFRLFATVLHSRELNMKNRIISKKPLLFRAILQFRFFRKGERTILREFLTSIEVSDTTSAKSAPITKKENSENPSDEVFDELDDLDL